MYPIPPNETLVEERVCKHCSAVFPITDKDIEFLDRLSPSISSNKYPLPLPTHCPKCRKIRRNVWRNEHKIFKRKCDATGKEIISLFSPDTPCLVYSSDYWYSDKWNALSYGRDFDFSKSFFEQLKELKSVVPMPGKAISTGMENSDYSDNCNNMKNCYLCFNAKNNEDCHYCIDIWGCKDCVDCMSINSCSESYELQNAFNCYKTFFSFDVKECRDSYFLYDCAGCHNCYGCYNQKNQKYMIFNVQYSEREYKEKLEKLLELSFLKQKEGVQSFLQSAGYTLKSPMNIGAEDIYNSEDIWESKNISHSKTIRNSQDIRYGGTFFDTKLVMDGEYWGDNLEQSYEINQVGEQCSSIYFSMACWRNNMSLFYCIYCVNNVKNCFGCIGLRNAEYCILNKQYTKNEYEKILPRIIEKMQQDGEWGEFFPTGLSHFGYNHTHNMDKYPLTRDEALLQGYNWSYYEAPFPQVSKIIPAHKLPDNIEDIPDDILNWAIECEVSKKPFRIVGSELEFYRRHNLPIPRKHPDERYRERAKIYLNY